MLLLRTTYQLRLRPMPGARGRARLAAWLLVLALLFSQSVGAWHRVAHVDHASTPADASWLGTACDLYGEHAHVHEHTEAHTLWVWLAAQANKTTHSAWDNWLGHAKGDGCAQWLGVEAEVIVPLTTTVAAPLVLGASWIPTHGEVHSDARPAHSAARDPPMKR